MKKKLTNSMKKLAGVILLAAMLTGSVTGNTVHAAAYTVTPMNTLMYTVDGTKIYADADLNSQLLKTVFKDQAVNVTGVTSNGWFQITAGGIYYVPGNGLSATTSNSTTSAVTGSTATSTTTTVVSEDVAKAIQGTFSYYTKEQLSSFTKDDIDKMSVNEYIKYLDSYLAGKSNPGQAIKKDNQMTIQTEYDKKVTLNATLTAKNTTEYLLQYRNEYLKDSFWGPVDTLDDVKVSINRAIRYGVNDFTVVCHAYSIGSNSITMKNQVKDLLTEIYDEQGVVFTSTQSYGTFTNDKGTSASGWVMQLTKSTTSSESVTVTPDTTK